jgi:outer membrane protein OmpA-like peptidoglycan-associated protein
MLYKLFSTITNSYTLLLVCSCFSFSLMSQNLVINGNIESSAGHRSFWSGNKDTNELTRNYFFLDESGCLKMDFDTTTIPHKVTNRYKRLVLFYAPNKNVQTYGLLAARFYCPLVKNEDYLVSFSIRNKHSKIKWRKMAYIISAEPLSVEYGIAELSPGDDSPPIYHLDGEVPDTFAVGTEFVNYTFSYKAKGGERYLYLGNIQHDQPSKRVVNVALRKYGSCSVEYDIDNMEVRPVNAAGNCMVGENNVAAPIRSDSVVTLRDVLFLPDSYELSSTSASLMNSISAYLTAYPTITALILGHTDSTGSFDYNLSLSQSRADAVKQQLVQLGIASERIVSKGLGSEQPIADNSTESGRSLNRRVEVVFRAGE